MATPAGRTLKEWLPVVLSGIAGTSPYLYGGIRTAGDIRDRQLHRKYIEDRERQEREQAEAEERGERNLRSVIERTLRGAKGPQADLLRGAVERDPSGSLSAVMRYMEGQEADKEKAFTSRMAALKERMAQRAAEGAEKAKGGVAKLLGAGDYEGARDLLASTGFADEAMRLRSPQPDEPDPWSVLDRKQGMVWNPRTQETKIIPGLAQDEETLDLGQLLDLEDSYNDAMESVVEVEGELQELQGELQAAEQQAQMVGGNPQKVEALKRKAAMLKAKHETAKKRAMLEKAKMQAAQQAAMYRPDRMVSSHASGQAKASHDTSGGTQYVYDPNRGGVVPAG